MFAEAQGGDLSMPSHLDDGFFVESEVISGLYGMKKRGEGMLRVRCHEGRYRNRPPSLNYLEFFSGFLWDRSDGESKA